MGDIIRVVRIYEFIGHREDIEAQIEQSLQGSSYFEGQVTKTPIRIRVGDFAGFPDKVAVAKEGEDDRAREN